MDMRRWLFFPLLGLVGLLFALPGSAAVRVDNAKVTIGVVDGQYQLNVENTGDVQLTQFTFVPAATLKVDSLVSSSSGSCQLASGGFACNVDLNPPPCMCNPGGNVTVIFKGTGESSSSTVKVGSVVITATGGGAVTPPPPPPPPVVTPPPKVLPKAKVPPWCKKGQHSTKKKPCRRPPLCKKGQHSTAKKPCRRR
jgi:hypothetical protein